MFHPSANRLAGFLEISALSISLAQSGGAQYKAGFLQIEPSGGGSFGRKSVGWRAKKDFRWCAIRESYLVVLEEPGEVCVYFRSLEIFINTFVVFSSKFGMFSFSTQISPLRGQSVIIVRVLGCSMLTLWPNPVLLL